MMWPRAVARTSWRDLASLARMGRLAHISRSAAATMQATLAEATERAQTFLASRRDDSEVVEPSSARPRAMAPGRVGEAARGEAARAGNPSSPAWAEASPLVTASMMRASLAPSVSPEAAGGARLQSGGAQAAARLLARGPAAPGAEAHGSREPGAGEEPEGGPPDGAGAGERRQLTEERGAKDREMARKKRELQDLQRQERDLALELKASQLRSLALEVPKP